MALCTSNQTQTNLLKLFGSHCGCLAKEDRQLGHREGVREQGVWGMGEEKMFTFLGLLAVSLPWGKEMF